MPAFEPLTSPCGATRDMNKVWIGLGILNRMGLRHHIVDADFDKVYMPVKIA